MKMTQAMIHTTDTFDALVALARSIRPSWQTPGIRQAIRDALARQQAPSIAELAYALIRCAENPTVATPAVVAMDGPHWRRLDRDPGEPQRATRCPGCGGMHMPGTDHQPRNGLASNPDAIAAMRNLIAGAKRPLPKETA